MCKHSTGEEGGGRGAGGQRCLPPGSRGVESGFFVNKIS